MPYGKSILSGLVVAAVLTIGTTTNAWAHKVIAAAYPDGNLIEGEIGFSSGDMAVNLLVMITDPDGNKLGEVTTDEEGLFAFTATKKVDHIFRADLSAGHVATFSVLAEELPDDLAGEGGVVTKTISVAQSKTVSDPTTSDTLMAVALAESSNLIVIDQAALEQLISKASKETRSLRKDLVQYKEERRLQDILGGIGYILGIFGIASFLLGRRKSVKEA
ncbi:cobalt ABC transporter permease [Kiloniella antarctica]|uniref:Cobalt ABC transporter permease n=1 Tax=Kiloniella antarctica TaxID=1550907 RepID=A0ABW5BEH9_9PROT